VSSGSLVKTLLLSLLISFLLITVAGHIHFGPVGTSLFVSAQFLFTDSFETVLLCVILEFTVEAVLSIPIGIVPWSGPGGNTSVSCLRCVCFLLFVREFPFLEGSDLLILVTVALLLVLHSCNCLTVFASGLSLCIGHNLVHLIQGEGVWIFLCHDFL
jgi:hypothetical protein